MRPVTGGPEGFNTTRSFRIDLPCKLGDTSLVARDIILARPSGLARPVYSGKDETWKKTDHFHQSAQAKQP